MRRGILKYESLAFLSYTYLDELLRKEQIYRYNQIPAVLLGPKDLSEPNWEELLYGRIEQAYRREFDPMRYAPVPAER